MTIAGEGFEEIDDDLVYPVTENRPVEETKTQGMAILNSFFISVLINIVNRIHEYPRSLTMMFI